MKTINISQNKVVMVDDCDYERLSKFKWFAIKGRHTYYAVRNEKGKSVLMHREIPGLTDRKVLSDHFNGNGLDNQRRNLRKCSNRQNLMNSVSRGGSSKHKGVVLDKRTGKWKCQIRVEGRLLHLGCFVDETEAAIKYNVAAMTHFKEYARLNVV